ncbi:MAG: glycosyl transferase family 1, partial [Clostridia bacterium]
GTGRELKKYRRLTRRLGLENRVVFDGKKSAEELEPLYELCPIAVDSLARHRSGIEVLSSLKSREYGAKGIPFINSCKIDSVGEDFPFVMYVPADERPVDMEAVLDFYHRVYQSSRRETAVRVRKYMEERTDVRHTMAEVAERFLEV